MRISAIQSQISNYQNSAKSVKKSNYYDQSKPQAEQVAFKGLKNATKAGLALGILGAIVGAIVSGGTSIIPTMAYFGICNGAVGATAGAYTEDD